MNEIIYTYIRVGSNGDRSCEWWDRSRLVCQFGLTLGPVTDLLIAGQVPLKRTKEQLPTTFDRVRSGLVLPCRGTSSVRRKILLYMLGTLPVMSSVSTPRESAMDYRSGMALTRQSQYEYGVEIKELIFDMREPRLLYLTQAGS